MVNPFIGKDRGGGGGESGDSSQHSQGKGGWKGGGDLSVLCF